MSGRIARDVRVRVAVSMKRERITEGTRGELNIAVRDPAKNGQANERVRELIADFHHVPVKNVRIVKGARSPGKIARVYA